jgi:hypothetical protein
LKSQEKEMMKKAVFGLVVAVMVIAAGCGGNSISEKQAAFEGYEFVIGDRTRTATNYIITDFVSGNLERRDGTETVTGYTIIGYTGSAKSITIPARIGGKPVIAIGGAVKSYVSYELFGSFANSQLTGITIPDSVTSIGDYAFYQNSLTHLTIPDSVITIGVAAFWKNQLTGISISDSVITIGAWAFDSNQLTSVSIPNSVTTIEKGAFRHNRLTSVSIGANVDVSEDPFPGNLTDIYTMGGRQAGTYTSGDGGKTWARR